MAYQPKTQPTRLPDLYAYSVKPGAKEGDSHWTRIGAVFENKDQQGFTILLDALPIGDRIVLRIPKAEEASA